MFAALNTIEPPSLELTIARIVEKVRPWAQERLRLVEERARMRLRQLAVRLGRAEWLDGVSSTSDLMMASVLLRYRMPGHLDEFPTLAAYLARGEARRAYQRAFAAQRRISAAPDEVLEALTMR